MRQRTDSRRQAILAAAWKVFKSQGYEKASMLEIAIKAKCTKATLYGYFRSKNELFTAALESTLSDASVGMIQELEGAGSIADRLQAFARVHMRYRLSSDMVAVDRILTEAARDPKLSAMREEKSLGRRKRIAEVLQAEMQMGLLRASDPVQAAGHLLALIEFDLVERRMRRDKDVPEAAIDEHIASAIDVFLRAYRIEGL